MKERPPHLVHGHSIATRICGLLTTSMLFVSHMPEPSMKNQSPTAAPVILPADHDWAANAHRSLAIDNLWTEPLYVGPSSVIVGQDEADMMSTSKVKLLGGQSWDGLVEQVCAPPIDAVSACDEALQPSPLVPTQHSETIAQTVVEAPSHDRSLTPDEKWKIVLDLARIACPSGAMFESDFEVRTLHGEDRDGRLGYTDATKREIVIDIRPAQRAVDVLVTYLHEFNHRQDVDGQIDQQAWKRATGVPEDAGWYTTGSNGISPAESLAILTSAALVGKPAFEDTMQNSGYPPNPIAVDLVARATKQQLQTAAALSQC